MQRLVLLGAGKIVAGAGMRHIMVFRKASPEVRLVEDRIHLEGLFKGGGR